MKIYINIFEKIYNAQIKLIQWTDYIRARNNCIQAVQKWRNAEQVCVDISQEVWDWNFSPEQKIRYNNALNSLSRFARKAEKMEALYEKTKIPN